MDNTRFEELIRGKNINFLIGAGASCPMYPTLNIKGACSLEDILSHEKLNSNGKRLIYAYYYEKWISNIAKDVYEYVKEEKEGKDSKQKVLNSYKTFISLIHRFLQNESNEKPKRINIFTTNYDLIFETMIDEYITQQPLLYFNDGSRGVFNRTINNSNFYLNVTHSGYNDSYKREVPTINLFKMHGSLSWEINKEQKNILVKKDTQTIKKLNDLLENLNKKIRESNYDNVTKFVENILLNFEYNKETVQEDINVAVENLNKEPLIKELDRFYNEYKNLPIINPDKYKFHQTVSEQYYYQLIRSFSYEMEKEDAILIVFGFSFADEHIQDIFERSLSNPKLMVFIISYSEDNQKDMKNKFEQFRNVRFLPSDFSFDSSNGKPNLGDFSYLLRLLGES